ncbi:MAG: 5-formyltetrahydrofolate cyclo-ligase [Alphaproteobacteria bacterium]|nr:5-formyltetrahydrofolate cyclo-ligase [Alphaproteobacteria bacterium]
MPAFQKKMMRTLMKEKRAVLYQQNPKAGELIAHFFFDGFDLQQKRIIGGYWPIGSELDLTPVLRTLIEREFICALPRITPEGLIFHQWTPLTPLEKGMFHVSEPPRSTPILCPEIIFVPLLAFDKEGHRLGYGQGHYDRYLHQHKALTIGIGFKGQEVERIPRQSHDFSLDYILTEEGLIYPSPCLFRVR